MKRKVKIVRRDYAAGYAKELHDYDQLKSWYELMIERANKKANAQETDRNELLERINHLRAIVGARDERIATLQAMLNRAHADLGTVSELRKTIANLENMVQARDKLIAELQETVDKLYIDLYKKEES